MKIKKLNINNFGLISKKTINLENGINVIYSENKQAKIVIQNFIICFLYGMDNDRKSFKSVFRRKYSPFYMESTKGELIVEKNNVDYSIQRSFGSMKSKDISCVTRVIDDEKIFNLNLDQPGKTFLDIGYEAFNRTMFVKSIDDFVNTNDFGLMGDIAKLKENFDKRFSFDRAVNLINDAKNIIKQIKNSESLAEIYEKYSKLNDDLSVANKSVYLNYLDRDKLRNLRKRKSYLVDRCYVIENVKKHFRYNELKDIIDKISFVEDEIFNLKQDIENIKLDMPVSENILVNREFLNELKSKVSIYKETKKQLLKADKSSLDEDENLFERFEFLNKELDNYSLIRSKFSFYFDRICKIDDLNEKLDRMKKNNKLIHLFGDNKNNSRIKKSKQKKNYNKFCIFVITISILVVILAPVFKISVRGIILISIISLILLGTTYGYMMLSNYKDVKDKDKDIETGKFYEIKNKISQIEKELYPYTYYKVKKEIDIIKSIEDELDELSLKFKEDNYSYTNVIKQFNKEEDILFNTFKEFGFEDLFIQDIENFVENLEFKLNHKENIEEDLKNKEDSLLKLLDNRSKFDLINEMESLEEYSSIKENKSLDEIENEYSVLKMELKSIDEKIIEVENVLEEAENNKKRVSSLNNEVINLRNTISYLESKIINIDVYRDRITDIYYELKENLSSEISMRMEYIIDYLTKSSFDMERNDKKYMEQNANGSVILKEKLGIEFLNFGMWDLIYFALRITVADLIYEDKGEIPLIIDDLFINYDLDRMKKALMLLEKYSKDRQVILFVSTKREIEYLRGNAYIIKI